MFQIKAKLLYNKRVKGDYFHMVIQGSGISKRVIPGQFVTVKVNDTDEPLLRRPFSIHRASGLCIEVLYQVVGKGTEILSKKKPREYLDTLGPLGNGFDYRAPSPKARAPILVAGGMGVAPLLFLTESMVTKIQDTRYKIQVLIGAKTKDQILCEKEFKDLGCDVKIATDDGSRAFKGKVTDLLGTILRTPNTEHRTPIIYACGPRPMLKEIAAISKKYNIPAQVSLEEHMACGIGACLGCVVKTKQGYKRTCKEGPVFNAQEIIWE